MNKKHFQNPQNQSIIGILLIFLKSAYKFFRGFWAVFLAVWLSKSLADYRIYATYALVFLAVFGVVYSIFYFKRYVFHIDYQEGKFILEKGVFSSKTIQIPFDKIQQVDLERSILQRLIGVYGVNIDTAGSKEDEVNIKALSKEEAQRLSVILTRAKEEVAVEDKKEEELEVEKNKTAAPSTVKKLWRYHLGFFNLLKVGLTKSYLRGFALIMIFISTILNQVQDAFQQYFRQGLEYSESFISSNSQNFLLISAVLVIVFLLSVVVTVGEVILKHFNLNIQQTPDRIEVEMGLKTSVKVSFQARRLQYLKVITNPIQKRLNIYETHFSLAGTQNNLKKSKIVAPGLPQEIVEKVKSFLYQTSAENNVRISTPRKNWPYRRYYLFLLGLALFWGFNYFLFEHLNLLVLFPLSVIYSAVIFPYQWFLYKTIRIRISDDFLIIQQGLWTQKTEIVEMYKMEGVSVQQPFWYRSRNIYNLTFHTAGGDIKIRAIPQSFIKEINFMLYKIESSQAVWM